MLSKDRVDSFIRKPLDAGLTRSEQMEMATELLSLREQLAALKALEPIGQIVLSDYDSDGTRTARVVCLHNQADWDNFQDGTLLFTAAKPACSQMAKGRLSDLSI
ncbi:TPA: hypothetical protein ACLFOO_004595 [Yersinia enterocolitica]|uniref:hypothetical protein n=1 Tax=Yersinia enterocolitica TaxID=630 RepID=UPI002AC52200|nr:hypothetical protein [Yersinia enterocolitica]HEN3429925.1 hypothetical protein [Yersinia enterocolitica]